eukprot:TRINITY_DN7047_c0_g1_i1.p1 TRINITY_DN7047_c0_g1~~TRINITY_DN7047_c0_g1_i1.p1  ORF type:complete len:548 (-),score=107.67 TRINITY_DN7047_c0_g1_i1:100-1743(-)
MAVQLRRLVALVLALLHGLRALQTNHKSLESARSHAHAVPATSAVEGALQNAESWVADHLWHREDSSENRRGPHRQSHNPARLLRAPPVLGTPLTPPNNDTTAVKLNDSSFWSLCESPTYSNLGGLGPDEGEEPVIKFGRVGTYKNKTFDMVIRNLTAFETNDIFRDVRQECFGRLNVKGNTSVHLNFEFYEANTTIPVVMDTFFLTVYDLEKSRNGNAVESVAMAEEAADFYLHPNTSVDVGRMEVNGKDLLVFNGTAPGAGENNPTTLAANNETQYKMAVSFSFKNRSSGSFILQVFGGNRGRNFFFEGEAVDVYEAAVGTTTTTTTTSCVGDSCIIWGDPHIIPFDVQRQRRLQHPMREAFLRTHGWKADQVSVSKTGVFWLVRSEQIQIQGVYSHSWENPNMTSLSALAVGGPFIGNNNLVIRTLKENCTWNGEEILPATGEPVAFVNDQVTAFYHNSAELVKDGTRGWGIDVTLPEGVKLTVNRWKMNLAAKITMPSQHGRPGGQGGQCGNYDGDASDDLNHLRELENEGKEPAAKRTSRNI